jgi:hypothetical protein
MTAEPTYAALMIVEPTCAARTALICAGLMSAARTDAISGAPMYAVQTAAICAASSLNALVNAKRAAWHCATARVPVPA